MKNKINIVDSYASVSGASEYVSDFKTYSEVNPTQTSTVIKNHIGVYQVLRSGSGAITSVSTNSRQDTYKNINRSLEQHSKRR